MYKLNIIFPAPMAELVDATDSKSVELRFMSVRVGLGVPFFKNRDIFNLCMIADFFWHITF